MGQKTARAPELLNEMQCQGNQFDVVTRDAVISARGRVQRADRALELLKEVLRHITASTAIMYSAAIRAC